MYKHKRFLTIVEGRELNQRMAKQVVAAAEKMGWGSRIVKGVGAVDLAENRLEEIFSDYVLWRGLDKNNVYEMERMIAFVNYTGRESINTHAVGGLSCASNKYFQHGVLGLDEKLRKHILPMYQVKNKSELEALIKLGKINYPFCLKPLFGTRGEGIILARSEKDLPAKLTGFAVEPYTKSEFDWRVFVLKGRVLGAMRKVGNEDDESDFRAKSGGKKRWNEEDETIRNELFDLSVRAAEVSGLDYTGVDLIRDDETGKFYVLETNFAGGWQNGFLEATGVDVPTEIMKYFESRYIEREGE